MARIFLIVWLLTTVQICPKFIKNCQGRFKILPNSKYTLKSFPKNFESLPKWRNIAKFGHTARRPLPGVTFHVSIIRRIAQIGRFPKKQCNQMARLFVRYLAIYSNEK